MNLEDIKKIQEKLLKKPVVKPKLDMDKLIEEVKVLDAKRDYRRTTPEQRRQEKIENEFKLIVEYSSKVPEKKDEEKKNDYIVHDPNKEWDVRIGDEIEYFDPTLSYELTGYRPITKTEGLDFDPKLFTIAADNYRRNGKYTNLVQGTFKHIQYWKEEFNRCLNGLTIGKYRITGENYFWLNYYRLLSVISSGNGNELRNEDFPVFVNKQYEYFHYLEMARVLKKDGIAFKSRAVGASEIAASNCAHAYTFHKGSINIVTAYLSDYVSKTLSKVWLQLNFLNTLTEGAFRHVRMKIDTDDHKKASKVDKDKNESGWMSEISGVTHDKPRKLRGDRVYSIFFEEAGSDPVLEETYTLSEALVKVAGKRCGSRFAFGCCCAGTKVMDGNGYLRNIEDMTIQDKMVGFDGEKTTSEKINFTKKTALKECVRVTLEGDRILECSIDHPLMQAFRKKDGHYDGKCGFIYASDIKAGDSVLSPVIIGKFGNIHEDDAFLLGALLGDGNYSSNNISICAPTEEDKLFYKSKYNCSVQKRAKDDNGYELLRIKNPEIRLKLKLYGMFGLSKENKQLPNNIWEWDKYSVSEFLSGYYSADGNVQIVKKKHRTIKLTCKYKHLLEQVHYLLRRFGIDSYLLYEKKPSSIMHSSVNLHVSIMKEHYCYVLYICNGDDVVKFREHMHLLQSHKQKNLDSYEYVRNRRKHSFKFELQKNGKGTYFIGKQINNVRTYKVKKVENIGLLTVYNMNCDETHTYIANEIITKQTGGDQGAALAAMKKMFYNPKSYKILPYKNTYGSDHAVLFTGYFIPAYTMWFGDDKGTKGLDDRGVVNEDAAKAYYQKEFDMITDPHLLTITKAEFCFTPEDAFILEGSNRFDREKLLDQYQALTMHKTVELPKCIKLRWGLNEVGEINKLGKPTVEFVSNSHIKITELPMTDPDGIPYNNLYVAGIDSIDADKSTSTGLTDVSEFCMVIMRRLFGLKSPKIVAVYKERPDRISTAFDTALKLCLFYNCKALIEATRVSIKLHFEKEHALYYLLRRPKATINSSSKTNLKQYGVPASEHIIEHQLDLVDQYISDYCDLIQFPDMLDELIRYSYENKRKFDIVAALGMTLLADEELMNAVAKPIHNKSFLKLAYSRNEYGQIELKSVKNEQSEYSECGNSKTTDFGFNRMHLF